MSGPNYASILDVPMDQVKPPSPAPEGTYLCMVAGLPREDKSTTKGTDYYEFTLGVIKAMDDVDEDELNEWLDGESLQSKSFPITFYLTDKSLYRLKDFYEHCGLEVEGKSAKQLKDYTPNCQVYAFVKQKPAESGRIFSNVVRTAAV